MLNRVYAVSDTKDPDPTYVDGVQPAVTAAVDYALAAIALGEERVPPPPPILLAQARLAARAGISLDTVLRRYFAGHALLGDFLLEEAEGGRLLRGAALQDLHRGQAALFDRLLAAVSEDYVREEKSRLGSFGQRKADRVERLLAGELVDTSDLGYELEGWHLGVVAQGSGVEETLRATAGTLDRRLLLVGTGGSALWAWFGGRHRPDLNNDMDILSEALPPKACVAVGEPGEGLVGWRLTHRQARAALPVVVRDKGSLVRYCEVALLASMLQDELLVTSLRQLYLEPLERERDGGEVARKTLRAYFAAQRNITSAAVPLEVSRHTVANRLRHFERRLGRPVDAWASEMEAALALDAMDSRARRTPVPTGMG